VVAVRALTECTPHATTSAWMPSQHPPTAALSSAPHPRRLALRTVPLALGLLRDPDALVVEPLHDAVRVVAGDHLAVADVVADAVAGLRAVCERGGGGEGRGGCCLGRGGCGCGCACVCGKRGEESVCWFWRSRVMA